MQSDQLLVFILNETKLHLLYIVSQVVITPYYLQLAALPDSWQDTLIFGSGIVDYAAGCPTLNSIINDYSCSSKQCLAQETA
jgi:hypothetical protein